MMKSIFLPLTALCIALTGLQARAGQPPDRFAKADTNHDGKLSLDEVNYFLVVTIFESRDANHDGKITLQEWVVKGDPSDEKAQEKQFRERDANHDGVVTVQEALAYGKKKGMAVIMMKKADTNKDGFLSRKEVAAYYASTEGPPR
jgi:Ca2+-binding EF-hand superfamily protein